MRTCAAVAAALLLHPWPAHAVEAPDREPPVRLLLAGSADGPAFDVDEYTGDSARSDITVTVTDLAGQPVVPEAGERLWTYWTISPSDAVAPQVRTPVGRDATMRDTSTYDLVPPLGRRIDGVYRLHAALTADTPGPAAYDEILELTIGEASVTLDDHPTLVLSTERGPHAAESPGAISGSVTLADGTPLPGREVALSYRADTGAGRSAEDGAPRLLLDQDDAPVPGAGARLVARRTDHDGRFTADLVLPRDSDADADERLETGTVTATVASVASDAGLRTDPAYLHVEMTYGDPAHDPARTCRCAGPRLVTSDDGAEDYLAVTGLQPAPGTRAVLAARARGEQGAFRTLVHQDVGADGAARFLVPDAGGPRATGYRIVVFEDDGSIRRIWRARIA